MPEGREFRSSLDHIVTLSKNQEKNKARQNHSLLFQYSGTNGTKILTCFNEYAMGRF